MKRTTPAAGLTHVSRQALTILRSLAAASEDNSVYDDTQRIDGWRPQDYHAALAEVNRLLALAPQIPPTHLLYSMFAVLTQGEGERDLMLVFASNGSGRLVRPYDDEFAIESDDDGTILMWASDAEGAPLVGKLITLIRAGHSLDDIADTSDIESFEGSDPELGEPALLAPQVERLIARFRAWAAESADRAGALLTIDGDGQTILKAYPKIIARSQSFPAALRLFRKADRLYAKQHRD